MQLLHSLVRVLGLAKLHGRLTGCRQLLAMHALRSSVFAFISVIFWIVSLGAVQAAPLVVNDVGVATVVGTGAGKRAIWTNGGTVGATTVDIVATLTVASLDHDFTTTVLRPSITSTAQDTIWVTWRLFEAGSGYDINTDTGGTLVVADVHVQFNDVDGPNNEEVYVAACAGNVEWVRIDNAATTGRAFGTVGGVPNVFSLIGDASYSSEPRSGLEISYPNTSTFLMGRTADVGYFIRLDNPTYSTFNTIDYACADFISPVAVDDVAEGVPNVATVLPILNNDSAATANSNPPANNTLLPSEASMLSVSLVPPVGATSVNTVSGDIVGFTMAGEGAWTYDELTGGLTFTPVASFTGVVTTIGYTFDNGLGATSNTADVDIIYPGIGVLTSRVLNDEIVVDSAGQLGETITYTYQVRPLGTPLTSVTLFETGFTGAGTTPVPVYVSGDADTDSVLDLGETWIYTSSYTIVAGDVAAGFVNSLATGTGTSPGSTVVTDLADSTGPTDGNGTGTYGPGPDNDDPTESAMGNSVIVATDDDFSGAPINGLTGGSSVTVFTNDTINSLAFATNLVTPTITSDGGLTGVGINADGTLSIPAGTPAGTYTVRYQICEVANGTNCDTADVTLTINAATISAVDDTVVGSVDTVAALTGVVNILSNDLLGGIAVVSADVTITPVTSYPTGFTVNADGTVDIAQFTVSAVYTFDYQLCENINPANCDTATVIITVEKSVPLISGTVYFDTDGDSSYDIGSDPPRAGYIVDLMQGGLVIKTTVSAADGSYTIRDFPVGSGYSLVFREPSSGVAIGGYANLTFGAGTALANQNQPIDPSGIIYNSTTGAPIPGVTVTLTDSSGVALPAACLLPGQQPQVTPADGSYGFDVVVGAAAQCPVGETEYRLAVTTLAGFEPVPSSVTAPLTGPLDATSCPGDAIPGGACQMSISSSAPLPAAPTPYYLSFLLQAADPNVINNHIPLDPSPTIPASGLLITNVVDKPIARRGDVVRYTITVSNTNASAAGPLLVRDFLPTGFAFVPGSASVDGVAVTPVSDGRQIDYFGIVVPANGSVVIMMSAAIGASVDIGNHIDAAHLLDPSTSALLAPIAKAIVQVIAEHVFDCGEIIGRVFDDANRNGYQDDGEDGLPGVRVATVRGVLITTDRYGRYSVPCAQVPDASIGSNFIMKLDRHTLPTGYAITTENPRVVRLTRGKIAKLNFGASIGRLVQVDLRASAFAQGLVVPNQNLVRGIDTLISQMVREPSLLKITYHAGAEGMEIGRARLGYVRQLIADRWSASGADSELDIDVRLVAGH